LNIYYGLSIIGDIRNGNRPDRFPKTCLVVPLKFQTPEISSKSLNYFKNEKPPGFLLPTIFPDPSVPD